MLSLVLAAYICPLSEFFGEVDRVVDFSSFQERTDHSDARPVRSQNNSWFLVYAKPRQEMEAESQLFRQGYKTFLPLVQLSRRRCGRTVTLVEAMFPRYLFVRFDVDRSHWTPIASTTGVCGLVRFGECFARVPDKLVSDLKRRHKSGPIEIKPPPIKTGDEVRIWDGIGHGYSGIVVARTARDRVKVLLKTAAGYTASVDLAESTLERLSAR